MAFSLPKCAAFKACMIVTLHNYGQYSCCPIESAAQSLFHVVTIYLVMVNIVMAYMVILYVVMTQKSYGPYSYGTIQFYI